MVEAVCEGMADAGVKVCVRRHRKNYICKHTPMQNIECQILYLYWSYAMLCYAVPCYTMLLCYATE